MNLLSKMFLILVFASTVSFGQNCKADVTIETGGETNFIYVDSVFVDKGTAQIKLSKGEYLISVVQNNKDWGTNSNSKKILIEDCEEKVISLKPDYDYYLLKTIPEDVSVYEEDSLIGYTPLKLSQSFNYLELNKKGYEEEMIDFNRMKNSEKIKLTFIGEEDEKSFFKTNAFKILLGSVAVLGATTAYFKLKADDNYDQYEMTGDESFLNKTDTYDLISGITFGALQINFGLLIYYFLIE